MWVRILLPLQNIKGYDLVWRHPLNVKMRRFINFCKESFEELTKKTTWPNWAKLQSSALLVILATVILAAILWVVDFAFQSLMTGIYTL